jgi:hypothetical protein
LGTGTVKTVDAGGNVMLLHVYYGDENRWDQANLDRVQKALRRQCISFDGLEAIFEYPTKDEALTARLELRWLGVHSEAGGVGEGPSEQAIEKSRDVMRGAFETFVEVQRRRKR